MRKFEQVLSGKESSPYAYDIKLIKKEIPELSHLSSTDIEKLYSEYSSMFAAGWICIESHLYSFKSWALGSNDE